MGHQMEKLDITALAGDTFIQNFCVVEWKLLKLNEHTWVSEDIYRTSSCLVAHI